MKQELRKTREPPEPAPRLEARVGIEPAYADLQSEPINNVFNALRDLFLHATAHNRLFLLNGSTYFYTGFCA